jgi:hypothetical protein
MRESAVDVSRAEFEQNLMAKLEEDEIFLADMTPLLRAGIAWDVDRAGQVVLSQLLARLPGAPLKRPARPTVPSISVAVQHWVEREPLSPQSPPKTGSERAIGRPWTRAFTLHFVRGDRVHDRRGRASLRPDARKVKPRSPRDDRGSG